MWITLEVIVEESHENVDKYPLKYLFSVNYRLFSTNSHVDIIVDKLSTILIKNINLFFHFFLVIFFHLIFIKKTIDISIFIC